MRPLPNLAIIAAVAANRVIGRNGGLPWRLRSDLAHFKRLTMGKPLLMGRATWESLPGLLPHRTHVVVTSDRGYRADGAIVEHSLEDALAVVADVEEAMVIGGGQLYAQALPLASRMYLTEVHAGIDGGDTRFPEVDRSQWVEVAREGHSADADNEYPYSFVVWQRISAPA